MATSASRTCWVLRSASEYTATLFTPRRLRVRMARTAISPRLAMRTVSNMGGLRGEVAVAGCAHPAIGLRRCAAARLVTPAGNQYGIEHGGALSLSLGGGGVLGGDEDRKSTRLNSSHVKI